MQKNREGFKNERNIHDSFALNIRRKDQIEKWFEVIGTNNPRHQTRYAVWKKIGYLPPKTNINERMALLQNPQ
ncbi:MAG: hypothetical protein KKD17_01255 [Nanoarchaeota archaeon]|nr:hypothetical protein [Nanoarchaeota archaeon]